LTAAASFASPTSVESLCLKSAGVGPAGAASSGRVSASGFAFDEGWLAFASGCERSGEPAPACAFIRRATTSPAVARTRIAMSDQKIRTGNGIA
jgi:hypothetical protein